MAKKNIKKTKGTESNKKDIKSLLIGLLIAFIIGLLIYVFGQQVHETNTDDTNDTVVDMNTDDTKHAKEMIDSIFNSIRTKNGFLNVVTDEDNEEYDSYYYNKNGEIFVIGNKDSFCNVYRKDNKALIFTDNIYEDYAIDIITLIENALDSVDTVEGVTMTQYVDDTNNLNKDIHTYEISVVSWEGVRALYEPVSTEFADGMIERIKTTLTESWVPNFKFRISVTHDGLFTASCTIEVEDKEYTQWKIDGYALLYDWELSKEWYEIDLTDAESAEKLLVKLMEDIGNMVQKYMAENPDMTINKEEVHDNGDGTHTHSDGTVHSNADH